VKVKGISCCELPLRWRTRVWDPSAVLVAWGSDEQPNPLALLLARLSERSHCQ